MSLFAIAFFAIRGVGTIGPPNLRWLLPVGFMVMTILPWIFLTRVGRNDIGLKRPNKPSTYGAGILYGAMAALLCFALGFVLYGQSADNWYVSIGNSYKAIMDTTGMSFWMLNLIFTTPALIFSPIGEEIFFRGVLQKTLEQKLSSTSSTLIECGLFGVVHLFHHGIMRTADSFDFLPVSGFLWVVQMFLVALLFAWLRKKSDSLYVAMAAHAAFNLSMNLAIFIALW